MPGLSESDIATTLSTLYTRFGNYLSGDKNNVSLLLNVLLGNVNPEMQLPTKLIPLNDFLANPSKDIPFVDDDLEEQSHEVNALRYISKWVLLQQLWSLKSLLQGPEKDLFLEFRQHVENLYKTLPFDLQQQESVNKFIVKPPTYGVGTKKEMVLSSIMILGVIWAFLGIALDLNNHSSDGNNNSPDGTKLKETHARINFIYFLLFLMPGLTSAVIAGGILTAYRLENSNPKKESCLFLPPPITEEGVNLEYPTLWQFSRSDLERTQEGVNRMTWEKIGAQKTNYDTSGRQGSNPKAD